MSTYKIVFLIVLAAVGLFIAAIVGSMFATKEKLPHGYELSIGGKGETWVQSADHKTLVTDIASVWASPKRLLIERSIPATTPPFEFKSCDYQATDERGVLRPVSPVEARAMLRDMTPRSAPSHSCLGVEG